MISKWLIKYQSEARDMPFLQNHCARSCNLQNGVLFYRDLGKLIYMWVQVFALQNRIKFRKFHIGAIKDIVAEKACMSFTDLEQLKHFLVTYVLAAVTLRLH